MPRGKLGGRGGMDDEGMRRAPEVVAFYQQLMRMQREGLGGVGGREAEEGLSMTAVRGDMIGEIEGRSSHLLAVSAVKQRNTKTVVGGSEGEEGLSMTAVRGDMIGEIEGRSSHLLAIKQDVEMQGDFINTLAREVRDASYFDIEDVVAFVNWLDEELAFLVDERAVLKHFDWPEAKADALREAAFEFQDLVRLERDLGSYVDDPDVPTDQALKKMFHVLEKVEQSIYALLRTRDMAISRYAEFGVPTYWILDNGLVGKIRLASVRLARCYITRVTSELDKLGSEPESEPIREFLLLQAVRFAFRTHQFAGGFDADSMRAFDELRARANLGSSASLGPPTAAAGAGAGSGAAGAADTGAAAASAAGAPAAADGVGTPSSSAHACPSLRRALPFLNPPLPSPSSFPLSFVLPPTTSPLPPPIFSPHLLRLAAPCGAPSPSHNPPLHPPPPLLSPTSSLSTISPLLHLFPLFICCSCCFLLLMATSLALPSLPLLVLQLAPDGSAVNFPSWLNCLERTLSGTLVSGFNLWFVTQQSGSGAIPTSPSAPTSSSSDPYADGLRAAIAETERLVATAQATATAAPDNAAARDLARILAESLESTRKRLTEHLAAPSPRSASTPLSSAPSHSDLLADWHVANARACQVILACLPPTLLPQCSHIRYAKDLLGYLTERFQSQTSISVIALLRELTSLRLADFTTMADYIDRVQTLSSQLAAQQFELSDHVCGALLLTGLTPEYSMHVTLYGERPADQWSFSRVSAFLLQAELNLRSCPPTAAAVTPSSAPPPLSTTTAAAASSRPRNTFPPCTYIIRQGPRKGGPCGRRLWCRCPDLCSQCDYA
ncbi:unnamed protein product [Closterium sp. Naga37s-1]|nr:unnamed protein product [Closterium sp. Naga37s-1]